MYEIEKQFQELINEAEEKFPLIGEDLRVFNSSNTENMDYLDYLDIMEGNPLSTISNHSKP